MYAHQIYGSQFAYDNATPPEDPPEPPSDGSVGDLMTECHTDLVTFNEFCDEIETNLEKVTVDRQTARILIAASRSKDPSLRVLTEGLKDKLEEMAGAMLDAAWEKQQQERNQ